MSDHHDQFAELFVRHQNQVFRYILSLLPDRSVAEDVFQQTSLTLWKRWQDYDPQRPFVPWACGIAHNHLRNHLRSLARAPRQQVFSEGMLEQLGQTRLEIDDALESRRKALATCLEELPRHHRELVERCYSDDESIRSIAISLDQTPNSLYKSLARLRQSLFECINHHVEEEDDA